MSLESLQRAAEAAGFATVSDDNQDAPVRPARHEALAPRSYPASLLSGYRALQRADPAPGITASAIWNRANLGQYIPAWAAKGSH